jgi:nitrous-oxide reductase
MRVRLVGVLVVLAACNGAEKAMQPPSSPGTGGKEAPARAATVPELMKARNLTDRDVSAALKTYMPTGKLDEFYGFASGGQSGQMIVFGVPSMRILKYVAVFTPEPWQGYGYGDDSNALIASGDRMGHSLTWGDMHHMALSETGGEYDGKYLFMNDKANARLAVVDLRDFVTVQIVTSELIQSDHGGAFVTPNTDYIIETSQYPAPLGGEYADLKDFDTKYRGAMIFWRFDRQKGRIVKEESFALELPPYMQDLADSGKLTSDGWAFTNSINTERAVPGNKEGRPSWESSASKNDMDYLHVINWKRAAEVAQAGKGKLIGGLRTIPLQTAIDEKLLFFVPEPKSPHGCDVTPDGEDIVIGGKLDTHATVFSFKKIKELIDKGTTEGKDPYGVPILPFKESIRGQCELGLGPLHTQYDDEGNAYTTLFIESKVAKWSLKDLKLIDKIPVHYNVGHLVAPEGDTVKPAGRYVIAMNKWSLDRFESVGPLLPQNFQLIDLHGSGDKMQLLYDMPIPLGEPHYAQVIKASRLKPWDIYSPPGINVLTHEKDPFAVEGGQERIERKPDGVHVYMTAIRSHFTPDVIRVKEGEKVHLHITNIEQARDATHGFTIDSHNVNVSLEPGRHVNIDLVATKPGVFPMYCTEFCSALHLEMAGYFLVEPGGR